MDRSRIQCDKNTRDLYRKCTYCRDQDLKSRIADEVEYHGQSLNTIPRQFMVEYANRRIELGWCASAEQRMKSESKTRWKKISSAAHTRQSQNKSIFSSHVKICAYHTRYSSTVYSSYVYYIYIYSEKEWVVRRRTMTIDDEAHNNTNLHLAQ